MRALRDRLGLDEKGAAIRGVRHDDERRLLIDGLEQTPDGNRHAVFRSNDLEASARAFLLPPDVFGRRELEGGCHDLPAPARSEIETRRDGGESDRGVRLNLYRAGSSAEKAREPAGDLV